MYSRFFSGRFPRIGHVGWRVSHLSSSREPSTIRQQQRSFLEFSEKFLLIQGKSKPSLGITMGTKHSYESGNVSFATWYQSIAY